MILLPFVFALSNVKRVYVYTAVTMTVKPDHGYPRKSPGDLYMKALQDHNRSVWLLNGFPVNGMWDQ